MVAELKAHRMTNVARSQCLFMLLFLLFSQEIMVGSMYQAETPAGLCKYKNNEKGMRISL